MLNKYVTDLLSAKQTEKLSPNRIKFFFRKGKGKVTPLQARCGPEGG
jgi:hypothetical protein